MQHVVIFRLLCDKSKNYKKFDVKRAISVNQIYSLKYGWWDKISLTYKAAFHSIGYVKTNSYQYQLTYARSGIMEITYAEVSPDVKKFTGSDGAFLCK